MTGTIFRETLRRNWPHMMGWGVGLGALGLAIALIVPNADMLKDMGRAFQNMPQSMLQMFGGEDAVSMTTPTGFLNLIFFSYAALIMAAYALLAGLNITAHEEDSKIMDVMLSLPVSRWKLVLERFLAYVVIIIGIDLLAFAGLWMGLRASPPLAVNQGRLLEASLNLLPSTIFALALTALLTSVMRRKNAAAAIAIVIILGSYFIDSIGRQASASLANTLRFLSFYKYYDSTSVIRNGLNWGNVTVLTVSSVVLVAGGIWLFQRRNISV